jgi:MFS family permease
LSILTLAQVVRIWHILLLATLTTVASALETPARHSFVPQMVGREELGTALALNSAAMHATRVLGPALAGIILAGLGAGWCFLFNAISFLGVLCGLVAMRDLPERARAPSDNLRAVRAGFSFALRSPTIRARLVLVGMTCFAGMPYAILLPDLAQRTLGMGARGLGLLYAASGVGAVGAALLLAGRATRMNSGRGASALFGVSLIALSLARSPLTACPALMAAGAGFVVQMISANAAIIAATPEPLRGRMMSFYSMLTLGMAPFGALFMGSLSTQFHSPTAIALGGACCCVGAVLSIWVERAPTTPMENMS